MATRTGATECTVLEEVWSSLDSPNERAFDVHIECTSENQGAVSERGADSSGARSKLSSKARIVCLVDESKAVAVESSCVTLPDVSSGTGKVEKHTVISPQHGVMIMSCQSKDCCVPCEEQKMTTKSFSLKSKSESDEGACDLCASQAENSESCSACLCAASCNDKCCWCG